MSTFGDLQKKRGKNNKTPFPFLLLLYISCTFLFLFFFLVLYLFGMWGHKSSFVGVLMDFLRLYLVPTLTFGSLGTATVRLWSGTMSTSGRLSRWFINLAAVPIALGFNSESSEGCLGLGSPTLHHLVLPLIWFSTTVDQGDVSLITL